MLSDILEPIALRMKSADVSFTEEVLYKVNDLNERIQKGEQLEDIHALDQMSTGMDECLIELICSVIKQNNPNCDLSFSKIQAWLLSVILRTALFADNTQGLQME